MDYDAHVFKTTDGGQNWTDISSNLPSIPVNDIVYSQASDLLFVATDLNVWYSNNDGANWDIVGNDLPLTIIRDLKIHEPTNTLYAGCFGRSMHRYDIDNIVLNTNESTLVTDAITMYPVPTQSELFIEHNLSSEGTITLYDISGKKLKTVFEGKLSDSKKIGISIDDLANGLYIVNIQSREKSVSKKVIVNR